MILPALRSLLLTVVDITDVVETRIRTWTIDQNEQLPAMDMRVVTNGSTPQTLAGVKPTFISYVTIDCYSNDPAEADLLAATLYDAAILSYRGTREGVFIHGISADGSPVQAVDFDPASENKRFVTSVDYDVQWSIA